MGNLRDGRWVVAGIDDQNLPEVQPGSPDEGHSWRNFDDVAKFAC